MARRVLKVGETLSLTPAGKRRYGIEAITIVEILEGGPDGKKVKGVRPDRRGAAWLIPSRFLAMQE